MNNREEKYWDSIPENTKKQIADIFKKNGEIDLFEKYKLLKEEDFLKNYLSSKKELDLLKLKIIIKNIILILIEKDDYYSSFIKFNIDSIEDVIEYMDGAPFIHEKYFDFNAGNMLAECHKNKSLFFKENYSNESSLKNLHMSLHRYKIKKTLPIYTYIMSDKGDLLKIGKSNNVLKRLNSMKTSNPYIKIYATCEQNIEHILHNKFKAKRVIGEWFKLSKEDLLFITKEFNFKIKP